MENKTKGMLAMQFKGDFVVSENISKAVLKQLAGVPLQELRSVLFMTFETVLQIFNENYWPWVMRMTGVGENCFNITLDVFTGAIIMSLDSSVKVT